MSWTGTVGFVGLGMMGAPMATRLIDAGFTLAVYDIDPAVRRAFQQRTGTVSCATAAEVGQAAEAVITMLPSGSAVAAAILGDDLHAGVLGEGATASLVVDMSSVDPSQTRELGVRLAHRGVRMVDAPVSGGVARAEAGTLAIMAGGEAADVAACRALFAELGEKVFHTGPLGSGHAVKALNNAVSAAGLIAATEALIVGQRAGVDPVVMLEVLNASSGANNATENKIGQFVLTRTFDSGFALKLMAKDLAIAEGLAESFDLEPELLRETGRMVAAAALSLGESVDHTAVARWIEEQSGAVLRSMSAGPRADAAEQ